MSIRKIHLALDRDEIDFYHSSSNLIAIKNVSIVIGFLEYDFDIMGNHRNINSIYLKEMQIRKSK